jgi:hypothetical protein
LQQREQRILKKLTEAREAQASSMTRFIQARARVMQVEARLQALRSHLNITPAAPVQPAEASPKITAAPTIPEAQKPASAPATEITSQRGAPSQISASETAAPAPIAMPPASATQPSTPLVKPTRTQFRQPTQFAEVEQETPLPAFDDPPAPTSEDDEETKKMPSLRPVQSVPESRQAQDEEETLNIALSALTRREQSEQATTDEARSPGATDITAKIPVIRREHGKPQEQT